MRVLHVIAGLGMGGAETLLARLATRPSKISHEIISLGPFNWYTPALRAQGVSVQHIKRWNLFKLTRLISSSDADIVQTWMYRPNVVGGLCARLAGKPVVWGIHCSSPDVLTPTSRFLARLGGWVAGWLPRFVINCSARSAEVHNRIGYARAPGAVVYNGYDPETFFPDGTSREEARLALSVPGDTFLIGSMTRWNAYKNVPGFLGAVRTVADRGLKVSAILLGHELYPDNPQLVNAIEEAGCTGLVRPLGRRPDVQQIARAMDLHVLSSFTEAFPNVVAETMLSGTANVVTDVGDSGAIVGDTGWLVPSGDTARLAAAIEQAYHEWKEQPGVWESRSVAARQRIIDNFTFERMAEEYEGIWRAVAASAKGETAVSQPN